MWFGSPRTPLTFVLTADLAGYLAAAVDAEVVAGEHIDIGWDRPVGMQDIADIAGRLLGEQVTVRAIPAPVIRTAGTTLGVVVPMVKDMAAMFDWFGTGRYVADTTRQGEVFGPVPTAEEAVARFGHQPRTRSPHDGLAEPRAGPVPVAW